MCLTHPAHHLDTITSSSTEMHIHGESDYLLKGKVPARARTTYCTNIGGTTAKARGMDRISGGSVFLFVALLLCFFVVIVGCCFHYLGEYSIAGLSQAGWRICTSSIR
jgi:hypothetical protein